MRRSLMLPMLVLAGGLLASCGKGSTTVTAGARTITETTHQTTPASTPLPSTPTRPPQGLAGSRQRALAFARAVNLSSTDVPGFTATPNHQGSSASEKQLEHQMLRCAGLGGGTAAIAEQSSNDFRLKRGIVDLSVSSEVAVESSPAQAQKMLAAIHSAHVRGCFTSFLTQIFKGERVKGATAGPVTIQSGTPPAPGMSGSFGWRVTATFEVHGVKVPIYLDFLGFVHGPSEVTLLSSGLLRPFPAEVQQHLFTLLLTRARTHAL
jgi:hypothetical protein